MSHRIEYQLNDNDIAFMTPDENNPLTVSTQFCGDEVAGRF